MWGEAQKCLVLCGKMAFPNLTWDFKKLKNYKNYNSSSQGFSWTSV